MRRLRLPGINSTVPNPESGHRYAAADRIDLEACSMISALSRNTPPTLEDE
jgi:hypothetical protein